MPLQRIQLRPGITRDTTNFAAEGTWWDCDKIRFRAGYPEKIGGWIPASADFLAGVTYSIRSWATLEPYRILTGIGTSQRFYVLAEGLTYDITPAAATLTAAAPLTMTNGSNEVVVNFPSHGLSSGGSLRIVSVTGATIRGIPDTELETTHVVQVVDSNNVRIKVTTEATSSGTGGGTTVLDALAPAGINVSDSNSGYGVVGYGTGGYGSATSATTANRQPSLWSQDNLGSDLYICPRGGQIYRWQYSAGGGFSAPAESLLSISAGLGGTVDYAWIPVQANTVLFDPRSEILIAVGVNASDADPDLDPMFVRWTDESNPFDWEPRIDNRAGGVRLSSGTELVTAAAVREEIVILSDTTVYSMQFIGGSTDQYAFTPRYKGITIQGPNALATSGGAVYWMGDRKFYKYDGSLEEVPCTITDYIFDDFSADRGYQVSAGVVEKYNEIWWFYCRAGDATPTRYVIYNVKERVWAFGSMDRSAWSNQYFGGAPIASEPNTAVDVWGDPTYQSRLAQHETGFDDGLKPTSLSAINAYIESADFDLSEGHTFFFVSKMIPDLTIKGFGKNPNRAAVDVTLKYRNSPGQDSMGSEELSVRQQTATQYSAQLDFRVRARQVALRFESDSTQIFWRLGVPRFDVRPDGRR